MRSELTELQNDVQTCGDAARDEEGRVSIVEAMTKKKSLYILIQN